MGSAWNSTYTLQAFLYSGGTLKSLQTFSGETKSEAYGINDSGQVVGWANSISGSGAFIYSGGEAQYFGTLGGPYSDEATAINTTGRSLVMPLLSAVMNTPSSTAAERCRI